MVELEPPKPSDTAIKNLNRNKVRPLVYSEDFHPREWKTCCGWQFGGPHTSFAAAEQPLDWTKLQVLP